MLFNKKGIVILEKILLMKIKLNLFIVLLSFGVFSLTAQEETEMHPYKKLTKKFIGAIKRNEPNKNSSFFDSTFYGKIIEASVDRELENFKKTYGPIATIEKTEVDTQGCKMATCTAIKTLKGKTLWRILFDQAQRIERFSIDTFVDKQAWFYKHETPLPKYTRKDVLLEPNPFIKLPGYLYLPITNVKKQAAIVLVHGSGPSDRHESIGPNKVFMDIAMGLVEKGFAVLCYDKRTYVYTANNPFPLDSMDYYQETIEDAVAAINYLKKQPELDSTKINLAGHSLGALCSSTIAKKVRVNKVVMLAAPARRLVELLPEQISYIAKIDGKVSEAEQTQITQLNWFKDKVMNDKYSLKSKEVLPGTKPKYWLTDKNFKAIETAKSLATPMLLLQGSRDYNVTLTDYNLWLEGMKDKSNFKGKLFDGLDHFYFMGNGLATPDAATRPNHVSANVIAEMASFLK